MSHTPSPPAYDDGSSEDEQPPVPAHERFAEGAVNLVLLLETIFWNGITILLFVLLLAVAVYGFAYGWNNGLIKLPEPRP